MSAGLTEIRLYGALGKRFGQRHRLAVGSVREAAQALAVLLPGFAQWLVEYRPGFQLFIGRPGGEARDEALLDAPVSARERICVVPVVAGAKRAGIGQILLGAALLVAAPYAAGALFAAGGAGTGLAITVATYAPQIGAALLLGGVVALLAPQPGAPVAAERRDSYSIGGGVAGGLQGGAVALCYGRVIRTIGADEIVSAGLLTEAIESAGAGAALPTQTLPPHQPLDPLVQPEWTTA